MCGQVIVIHRLATLPCRVKPQQLIKLKHQLLEVSSLELYYFLDWLASNFMNHPVRPADTSDSVPS